MVNVDSLFLKEEVSIMFLELGLNFVYVKEIDALFAFTTLSLPTKDYPFLEFKGFLINEYRTMKEYNKILEDKISRRALESFNDYQFSTNYKWIVIKDELTTEKTRRLKNLRER